MGQRSKNDLQAFSLVEILVAITLVAILMALAIPSYSTYVQRVNRGDAAEALLNAARCQEQLYVKFNGFDPDSCGGMTGNGLYSVTIATSNANQNFVASATPVDRQAGDVCGTLTLSGTGVKTAGGKTGTFAEDCWTGRKVEASE